MPESSGLCCTPVNVTVQPREGEHAPPEGYPLPVSPAHRACTDAFSVASDEGACSSSYTHPSIHASRVTLAATLAAPTILNFWSAFAWTVKDMSGNREER